MLKADTTTSSVWTLCFITVISVVIVILAFIVATCSFYIAFTINTAVAKIIDPTHKDGKVSRFLFDYCSRQRRLCLTGPSK